MLYTKEPLKENFLVMVAELFYWFEIKPLSVVTGGGGVSAPASGEGDGKFKFEIKLLSVVTGGGGVSVPVRGRRW